MGSVLMVLFAYLLGSVPTGFLLGSLSGVDVRKSGSGNVGANNVARVLGTKLYRRSKLHLVFILEIHDI